MKVAVIENNLKDYIINIFNKHLNLGVRLVTFLDWKPQQELYQEIPIKKIEELSNGQYDIIVIAVKENRYLSRLLTYLHKKKIQNIYIVKLFALDIQKDFIDEASSTYLNSLWVDCMPRENEKPYLVHLETHVCDHCNLNCKACNNFSPFVKEPSYANIVQFERDLRRLTELFSGIGRFFLLGGEPLLAPELCCDMIRCYRSYFPTNELRVLTNAMLILSMKEEFWECIRENNVIIHISLYPPAKGIIDKIREKLENEKVRYLVYREVRSFVKHWTKYPFEDEKYNNDHCGGAGCHYLRNGQISKCPDAILVQFMANENNELLSMQSNDRVNILQDIDVWKMIEQLDSPIDLCKKCTCKRLKSIQWERVKGEAQTTDWLLPHRYEAEVDNLIYQNNKAKDEIGELKSEIDILKRKITNQINVIARKEGEIREGQEEVKIWKKRCNHINSLLQEVRQDNERIINSYSHKIGKFITWFPRMMRKIARHFIMKISRKTKQQRDYKCSSESGYDVLKGIFKCSILNDIRLIYNNYKEDILNGYKHYKLYIEKYGENSLILKTSGGTGDVYMAGLYYDSFIKTLPEKTIPIFTVIHQSGYCAAELFGIKNIELIAYQNRKSMVHFGIFCGFKNVKFKIIHHNPLSLYVSILSSMETVNGICSADVLRYVVYNDLQPSTKPCFSCKGDEYWQKFFEERNLIIGKTVLLCPYSVSMQSIAVSFWEELAKVLISNGYSVVTNVKDASEKPIKGTIGINISIKDIVPFLNKCGNLIGVRSGLMEVTESASINRVILYSDIRAGYRGKGGHNKSMIEHFSFNQWFNRQDALELEYSEQTSNDLFNPILTYLGGQK